MFKVFILYLHSSTHILGCFIKTYEIRILEKLLYYSFWKNYNLLKGDKFDKETDYSSQIAIF